MDRYFVLKNHLHIVLGIDSGNALGVVRSLGEYGIKPIVICPKHEKYLCLTKSRYVGKIHRLENNEEIVRILLDYNGNTDKHPFVYSCLDVFESELDKHYDELKDKFYFFHCGKQNEVTRLMDKNTICEIAINCGIAVPIKELVVTGELPHTLSYPIITKAQYSMIGGWKHDVFVCNNEQDLMDAYTKIKSPSLLLQEYVDKKNEVAVMGFSINGGQEICAPFQLSYFRSSRSAYGHYMHFKPIEQDVLKKVKSIISKCKFSGCFEVEFLQDKNDNLFFLEVNFRYSFWNYALTYGGINYPLEWAKATLENKIIPLLPKKCNFTAMNVYADFSQSVLSGNVAKYQWIKDFINADLWYIFNKKDPKPAMTFYWSRIFNKIKKRC